MAALQRVGVLVKRGAVEIAQPMRIVGKMPGHPVQHYAETFAMAGIHQRGKILRSAKSAGRRVQTGRLIAPRAVERVFADGQKFDVSKAEIADIARKLLRQVAIGQPFVVALAPPRAEVDLVDRHRRSERVDISGRRPGTRQLGLVENDGCRLRTHLGGKCQWIGFQRQVLAVGADNIKFVMIAGLGVRNEQLPIADPAHAHWMAPCVPEIEIADHADPPRIGREHDEAHPGNAIQRHRMRAKLVVDSLMGAFAQKIEIEVAQNRRKAVGVVELDHGLAETGAQLVALGAVRKRAGKQACVMNARQRCRFAMFADRLDVRRLGQERAYYRLVALFVEAEIMKWI